MLIFRAEGNTAVHSVVAVFARGFTFQWPAGSAVDAALASLAIVARAAFLAHALAAEESGRAIGGTRPAVGRVGCEIDAFAVAAGEPVCAIRQARTTEVAVDANAVAAFLGGRVAAVVVASTAGELGFTATGARGLVALAGWAARRAAAAVVLDSATRFAAQEPRLLAGSLGIAFPAIGTVVRAAALRAIWRRAHDGAAGFVAFAGRHTLAAIANLAGVADDRLAHAIDTWRACVAIGEAGTALRGVDADAVTAFLGLRVATRIVAFATRELSCGAAGSGCLVALARWATGRAAAAVVGVVAAFVIAKELTDRTEDGLGADLVQVGGSRTSQDGAAEERFQRLAARKPGCP